MFFLVSYTSCIGEELPINERQIVHTNNGSLVLRKILQSDAGIYNCTIIALDHKFKSNANNVGKGYSEKTTSIARKVENENSLQSSAHNGLKSASSSMRIKVIGTKAR